MKNIPHIDITFIVCTAGVLLLIDHFLDAGIFPHYTFLVVLVAYYIGKYIGVRMKKRAS